ncbi:MAG TPA: hypothetical protein VK612_13255 [Pyrinomonadaceae bacterium]|nr:hypothetical protein [Pyrinomonadaceae bacterium]
MNNYQITIVEPTAVGILEEMARKNLIKLLPVEPKARFKSLLAKMRGSKDIPSIEDIANEVESVRTERHSGKHED